MLCLWSYSTMLSTHLRPSPIFARISLTTTMCTIYCNIHWWSSEILRLATHFHTYHVKCNIFCLIGHIWPPKTIIEFIYLSISYTRTHISSAAQNHTQFFTPGNTISCLLVRLLSSCFVIIFFSSKSTSSSKLWSWQFEPGWFNNNQIFHLYRIHRITHDHHLAYMLCATQHTCMFAIWRSSIVYSATSL